MSESDSKIDETQTPLDSPNSTNPKAKIADSLNIETELDNLETNNDKSDNGSTNREKEKNQSILNLNTNLNESDNFIEDIEITDRHSARSGKTLDCPIDNDNDSTEKVISHDNEGNFSKENNSEVNVVNNSSQGSISIINIKSQNLIEKNSHSSITIRDTKMSKRSKSSKKSSLPPVLAARSNEYTHLELKRIKEGLSREVNTIKFPKRKEHTPFVFNDLNPYYDTRHVENLIKSPLNSQHIGYYNRYTATSIVEPWVAYRMERTLPPSVTRSLSHSLMPRSKLESDIFDRPDTLEGSTLAPNFPKVIVKKPRDLTGPFYVDDVQTIRSELKKNLNSTNRFEEDRKRTIHDYFRMKLNETADREGMSKAYHAYLENSPGSKKALKELLEEKKDCVEVK